MTSRTSRAVSALMFALAQVAVQPGAQAAAATPVVASLKAPTSTSVGWQTLKITVHFEGGWATAVNECSMDYLSQYVQLEVVVSDTSGFTMAVASPDYDLLPWKGSVTPTGLDCTVDFGTLTPPVLRAIPYGDAFSQQLAAHPETGRLHVGVRWVTAGSPSKQVQWLTPAAGLEIRSARPIVTLEGLTRGQVVDWVVPFKMRIIETPEVPVTGYGGANCDEPIKTPNPDGTRTVLLNCWHVFDRAATAFTVSIATKNETYNLDSPALTVRSYGALTLKPAYSADESTATRGAVRVYVDLENSVGPNLPYSLADTKLFYSIGSEAPVALSLDGASSLGIGGLRLITTIPVPFGTSIITFSGSLHGLPLLGTDSEKAVTLKVAAKKPVAYPRLTVRMSFKAPKSARWPNPFSVAITTTGTGSATCLSYFQGSMFRFNVKPGRAKLTVKAMGLSPKGSLLKIQCSPPNWPDPAVTPPNVIFTSYVKVTA